MEKNGDQMAFPLIETNGNGETSVATGLTKREYFAGLAMQGLIANSALLKEGSKGYTDDVELMRSYAEDAVVLADQLLRQLTLIQ